MVSLQRVESKRPAKAGRGAKPKNLWRIQFRQDKLQVTIRLGALSVKAAEEVTDHIDHLIACKKHSTQHREHTKAWLASADSAIIHKLADYALCDRPKLNISETTWLEHSKDFLERQANNCNEKTIEQMNWAYAELTIFLRDACGKDDIPIKELTKSHAKRFYHWMTSKRTPKLGENTAKKRLARIRSVIHDAVELEIVPGNVFVMKSLPVVLSAGDKKYVPEHVIEDVIGSLSDDKLEWKLLLAFGRYIGNRMPSEIEHLTWDDINWKANTIKLTSPKTRKQKKPRRLVPIFPEVEGLLKAQLAESEDEGFVFPRLRHHRNAGTTCKKMVAAAGHKVWPKFWNSLRASRETDLMDEVGLRRACAWIGNSIEVAESNYRLLKDTDYVDAGARRHISTSDDKSDDEWDGIGANGDPTNEKTPVKTGVKEFEATRHGLEP